MDLSSNNLRLYSMKTINLKSKKIQSIHHETFKSVSAIHMLFIILCNYNSILFSCTC